MVRGGLAADPGARCLGGLRAPAPTRRRTGAGSARGRPRSGPARRRGRPSSTPTATGSRPCPAGPRPAPSCMTPSPDSAGSSSCRAITPPHSRWYWSALRSIPAEVDRLAVVGEAERAGVAQRGHLGQLVAAQAARDRSQEAGRDAGLALGARRPASRSTDSVVDDRVGVRHRDHRAEAAGGRRGGAGLDVLLVLLPGRAQVHVRVDERREHVLAGRIDRARRVVRGAQRCRARRARRSWPSRIRMSSGLVELGAGVEDVRRADQQLGRGRRCAGTLLALLVHSAHSAHAATAIVAGCPASSS